jgi:osmotically-inducible protein OsmY
MKRIHPLLSVLCASAIALAVTGARAADQGDAIHEADDTGRNVRDQSGKTATPDKQSNDARDLEITRQIRRAITEDDSLSTNAHNVKIVTQNGVVTLRGPVDSEEEKDDVFQKARTTHGVKRVDNQLEIAG